MKHSYADEIRPPREPIEPIIVGWWDVLSLIAQVILCGAAVVAVFLVLFLWAGAIVEAP